MEFRILGPLEVEEDGRQVPLGGEKQRALLALLLLSRGRPVSTDRLIDDVWSGEPPPTAVKSVQVYVTRLRRALGDGRIITRGRGYELAVAPGEIDVDRFDALVRAASGAPAKEAADAAARGARALSRPAARRSSLEPWAQVEIARLEERQLAALEARIDADLELGRHRELIAELEALVTEHPFREHLLEQLVLALYRSGRQADALDAYRRGADRLRSELGLEPGRSLQELEHGSSARIRHSTRRGSASGVTHMCGAGGLSSSERRVIVTAAVAAAAVALTRGSDTSLASVAAGVAIVDASSGRLVAHIGASRHQVPGGGHHGRRQLLGLEFDPYEMVQIDPDDGHIVRRIGSPFGEPAAQGSSTVGASGSAARGSSAWISPRAERSTVSGCRRTRKRMDLRGWRGRWIVLGHAPRRGGAVARRPGDRGRATSLWRPTGRITPWCSATEPSGSRVGMASSESIRRRTRSPRLPPCRSRSSPTSH